ncbi:WD40 repeat domain-containing protein [Lentzea californiensis]|uniref:WD40 repeat domain-containing protein n=1 Tax=Lentzea californiensis TaxID=438851 RepID=UPI00216694E4|nr:hypothetical protein [Lentzea californiensis]
MWDAATGALSAELTGHTDIVHAVAFSPDGATLASAGAGHDVRLWRRDDLTPPCPRRPSSDRRPRQLHLVIHDVSPFPRHLL